MSIWHIMGTFMAMIGLMEILLGKEITTPDGAILGTASDIELDLIRHKIWVMVKGQGQWVRIPSEKIASLTGRVILFDNWLNCCPLITEENDTMLQIKGI